MHQIDGIIHIMPIILPTKNRDLFPLYFISIRLFESVARSCMVVKTAAAQQQNVEGELQECN